MIKKENFCIAKKLYRMYKLYIHRQCFYKSIAQTFKKVFKRASPRHWKGLYWSIAQTLAKFFLQKNRLYIDTVFNRSIAQTLAKFIGASPGHWKSVYMGIAQTLAKLLQEHRLLAKFLQEHRLDIVKVFTRASPRHWQRF